MPEHVVSAGPSQHIEVASHKERVSWLAIWNRDLSHDKLPKATSTDSLKNANDVENRSSAETTNDGNNDEEQEDSQGLLCSCVSVHTEIDKHTLARKIGLAQGLLDFTRSFNDFNSGKLFCGFNTSDVQSVYSQNQRLIFLEPEPNFWLVAAFEHGCSTAAEDGKGHGRNLSTTSSSVADSPTKRSTSIGASNAASTSARTLKDCLWRAYYGFKLQYGLFTQSVHSDSTGKKLKATLRVYFQAWLERPLQPMPLGIPRSSLESVLLQSVTDTLSQYQLNCAFVLHETGILHLASEQVCTQAEALSLVEQSMKHLPQQHFFDSASVPISPLTTSSKTVSRKRSTLSGPSWKNLGLGGFSGYMAVPSMPSASSLGVGLPSFVTRTPPRSSTPVAPQLNEAPSVPPVMPRIRESSSGWLPSLGLFSKAKVQEVIANEITAAGEPLRSPTSHYGDVAAEANAFATHFHTSKDGEKHDVKRSVYALPMPIANTGDNAFDQTPYTPPPFPSKPIAVVETSDIYLDKSAEFHTVTIMKHANILFAFLGDMHDQTQNELRNACIRSIARDVGGATNDNSGNEPDRVFERVADHSIKSSHASKIVVSDTASASKATRTARDAIAAGALTHVQPYSKLSFKEIYVRASSLQWIYASTVAPSALNVKLLPKSVGKEGSLADADVAVAQQHVSI